MAKPDYEGLYEEQRAQSNVLAGRLTETQRVLARTEQELGVALRAAAIAPGLAKAMQEIYDRPMIIEVAETEAKERVIKAEEQSYIGRVAAALAAEHGDEYRMAWRAEHGAAVRERLDGQNREDETYTRIEADVEAEERSRIMTELIEQRKAEVLAELSDPQRRATIIAELRTKLDGSEELTDYRSATEAQLRRQWRETALEEAKTEIGAEVAAGEQAFIATAKEQYRQSYDGQRYRDRVERELANTWRTRALREVAEEIQDEELIKLLGELAEQGRKQSERELAASKLLEQFTYGGLDTTAIEANSVLTIYLGDVVTEQERDYNGSTRYGDYTMKPIEHLYCHRTIRLTSLGEGRFLVDHDSLADVDTESPLHAYVKNDILRQGTVIIVGRSVTDQGENKLQQTLAMNVELFTDDDTADNHITGQKLHVANVELDGVKARTFGKETLPKTSKSGK